MRIFTNFLIAQNEIARELKEFGILYQPETVQDRDVSQDKSYEVRELLNYQYMITNPRPSDFESISTCDWVWCLAEFQERISLGEMNPGSAWQLRRDYWKPFLKLRPSGFRQFSYNYQERLRGHLDLIIRELRTHPHSRQLYLSIWDRQWDPASRGRERVPCSLGYWFAYRNGELHMTYLQRSSDYFEHFTNDVCLAIMLQDYVARRADLKIGRFTHWLGSLHTFAKDVEHVF